MEENSQDVFSCEGREEFVDILSGGGPVLLKDVQAGESIRLKTEIGELDRVLGGGIVRGAVTLLGGDPGIGKSTISLQISRQLAESGHKILYISGEESIQQTKVRAERLGVFDSDNLYIVNQTDLSKIIESIKKLNPEVVVIDSIQVIFNADISSGVGSVSQVRECAGILTRIAKAKGVSMFIIGHVTKEGLLAGPRVLEHIVDTVLYFEGERHSTYRILRAVKNRFGSTNEIGVFQMTSRGLAQVDNPSEIFISQRPLDTRGSVITSVLEGSRTMLLEVQALTSRNSLGAYPARRSEGFDQNRLNLIVAVLEKKIGLNLSNQDIFVNIVGGVKVEDPSCDLAVAIAIASSFKEKQVSPEVVIVGEVGLASEVRNVTHLDLRINEAQRLGFKECIIPLAGQDNLGRYDKAGIKISAIKNIQEAIAAGFIKR